MLALVNIAMFDASVSAWDMKLYYDRWRPVDAIRYGGSRCPGSGLVDDPEWESFVYTPDFPDYVSGHSTFSAAAASVLQNVLCSDNVRSTGWALATTNSCSSLFSLPLVFPARWTAPSLARILRSQRRRMRRVGVAFWEVFTLRAPVRTVAPRARTWASTSLLPSTPMSQPIRMPATCISTLQTLLFHSVPTPQRSRLLFQRAARRTGV